MRLRPPALSKPRPLALHTVLSLMSSVSCTFFVSLGIALGIVPPVAAGVLVHFAPTLAIRGTPSRHAEVALSSRRGDYALRPPPHAT